MPGASASGRRRRAAAVARRACGPDRRARPAARCTGPGRLPEDQASPLASSCGRRGGRPASCRTICGRSARDGRRSRGTHGGAPCPCTPRAAGPSSRSWAGSRSAANWSRPVSRVPSAAPQRAARHGPPERRCRARGSRRAAWSGTDAKHQHHSIEPYLDRSVRAKKHRWAALVVTTEIDLASEASHLAAAYPSRGM